MLKDVIDPDYDQWIKYKGRVCKCPQCRDIPGRLKEGLQGA